MENTKRCSKCGRELPLEYFSKDKSKKDGLCCWCKECQKQRKSKWDTKHVDEIKQYNVERYASIDGYAYHIRYTNLKNDRKRGRCGKDEDPLPPHFYYIEKFSEGIDYYDGKHYPFNELGFDRIDDSKPHTIDNMVVATTEHNIDRWHKRMTVEEYREYIQKEKEELELTLN